MRYKIAIDSCGELLDEWKNDERFETVPLTLMVGAEQIIDDETFNQKEFLKKVADCPECPKSACPSPERYMKAYDCEAEHIYAVTLSSELSGSYNSALLGRNLLLEDHPEKKIHVFNSCSASVGETLIAKKIAEYEEAGLDFEAIIEKVDEFILHMHTYFVLESLDNLRKNGRLSAVKALVATALNIKPVMGATDQGVITQLGQARGMQKALRLMAETIAAELEHPEEKVLGLVHCNNPKRAEYVKQELMKLVKVKDIIVLESSGVSTLYAAQGGIIIAV